MTELKSCPFCGGDAFAYTQGGRYGRFAWAECELCGARTKNVASEFAADDPDFGNSSASRRIAAAWNRRCNDA